MTVSENQQPQFRTQPSKQHAESSHGVNVAERNVEVKNLLGLNLGAAAALAGMANKFTSQIMIGLGKNQVSAKSIVQLIILGAGLGSRLQLRAEGSDADEAVAAIQALFERRFGEE
jgi:phosphocarrier protein HPr